MAIEKSGSLVALACLLGTILATDEYPENIETYSKYIGLIGQINNDIADVNGSKEKNDLINKEYSLPIIYLLSSQDEKLQFIRDYYENKVNKSKVIENLEQVKKKIHDSGAILYTEVIKKIYQNKAKTEMESLNLEPSVFSKLLKYIY
jgi:competence protein ComQ